MKVVIDREREREKENGDWQRERESENESGDWQGEREAEWGLEGRERERDRKSDTWLLSENFDLIWLHWLIFTSILKLLTHTHTQSDYGEK